MDTVRPSLTGSVVVAIFFCWLSVFIGLAFLFLGHPPAGVALADAAWSLAYAGPAVGLQMRIPAAWGAGLAVSGLAYAIGLTSLRVLSTSLVIFIALLLPSTRRAVREWRLRRGSGG